MKRCQAIERETETDRRFSRDFLFPKYVHDLLLKHCCMKLLIPSSEL
jgi:hypothetical protein